MEKQITATRSELSRAFAEWTARAKAEGWPDTPNPDASADELIRRVEAIHQEK